MRYPRLLISLALVLVGLVVAAVLLRSAPPSVEPSSQGSEPPEAARFHAAYQEALARRLDWNYVDTELLDIARDLQARLQLPIEVDRASLALVHRTKLTFVAENVSVRNGLEFLLQPTLLTFVPYDGKLFITNQAFADSGAPIVLRRYSVADLRQPTADAAGRWQVNLEPLRIVLHAHVGRVTTGGFDMTIEPDEQDENSLLIGHLLDEHEHIEALLEGLRRVKREHAPDSRVVRTPVIDLQRPDPIVELRARRADLAFEGSLEDWGKAVQKSYGLYVHLFPPVLIDPGVEYPRVLKGEVTQARLDDALDHFLTPHRLQYRLRTDAIVVFVPFGDPGFEQHVQAFPVWDLAPSLAPDARSDELEKLAAAVQDRIQATSFDWTGGPGAIDTWLKPATLIVTNTQANLALTAQTLKEIRARRQRLRE